MKPATWILLTLFALTACKSDPDPIQFTGTVLQMGSDPVPDALVEIKLTPKDAMQPINTVYAGTTDQNGRYAITVSGIDKNDYRYVAFVTKAGLVQTYEPIWRPAVQSQNIYLTVARAYYLRIDLTLHGLPPSQNGVKDSLGVAWRFEKADGSPIYPEAPIKYYTDPYVQETILAPFSRQEARTAKLYLYRASLPGVSQFTLPVELTQADTTKVIFQP